MCQDARPASKASCSCQDLVTTIDLINGLCKIDHLPCLINILINAIPFSALVDTGATISVVSQELVYQLNKSSQIWLNSNNRTATGVDGRTLPLIGNVDLSFTIFDKKFDHNFTICRGSGIGIILGLDFLRQIGSVIDLKTNMLTTAFGTYPLMGKDNTINALKVQATRESDGQNEPKQVNSSQIKLDNKYQSLSVAHSKDDKADDIMPTQSVNHRRHSGQPRKTQKIKFDDDDDEYDNFVANESIMNNKHPLNREALNTKIAEDLAKYPEIARDDPRILALLDKHKDGIVDKTGLTGLAEKYGHRIELIDQNCTIYDRPRPLSPHEKKIFRAQTDKWLINDIIEPSTSRHNIRPTFVKKEESNEWRVCLDLRLANKAIKRVRYPLPTQTDVFERMSNCKYFTKIDLKEAFLQIPIHPDSRELLAFETPWGKFQFKTMPYGMNNASEIFQKVMDQILREEIQKGTCSVFVDDVTVHTKGDADDHMNESDIVMSKIRQAGLKMKKDKLIVCATSIPLLGSIVDRQGIQVNPKRTQGIDKYPMPTNLKALKRFLGMTGYVRKYIKDYAKIAQPLTDLTRDYVPFVWTDKCTEAFQRLKQAMSEAPVLALPDFGLPFRLYADASGYSVGATLMQDAGEGERPIAYASKTLSKRERGWQTTEREAFALYWATQTFSQYLKGVKFTMVTDHKPITWLKTCKKPTPKVNRWILWLNEFDFDIEYQPGEEQFIADALSRISPGRIVSTIRFADALAWQPQDLITEQRNDPDIGMICQAIMDNTEQPDVKGSRSPRFKRMLTLYDRIRVNNQGYCVVRDQRNDADLVILPKTRRGEIFHLFHSIPAAGHLSASRTLANIQAKFYWPGMSVDILNWCNSCIQCATVKVRPGRALAPCQPIEPPERPFQYISMDVNTMPIPTPRGNKHVLVITCLLTKWVEVYAMPNERADTICLHVIDWISRHGCPERLLTDQGRNFESNLFKGLCQDLNIQKQHTTAYHPAGNGGTERVNRDINDILAMFEQSRSGDWDLLLPQIIFAYRTAKHSSTGMSPFQAVYHFEPILPGRLVLGSNAFPPLSNAFSNAQVMKVWRELRARIVNAQRGQKEQFDKRASEITFQPGDVVLLKKHVRNKLNPRYRATFTIVKQSNKSPVLWHIVSETGNEQTVHANDLKKFNAVSDFPPYHPPTFDDTPIVEIEPDPLPMSLTLPRTKMPNNVLTHQVDEPPQPTLERLDSQPENGINGPSLPIEHIDQADDSTPLPMFEYPQANQPAIDSSTSDQSTPIPLFDYIEQPK